MSNIYPAIEGVIEYLEYVGQGMAVRIFDRARPQYTVDVSNVELSVALVNMEDSILSEPEFG